MAVPPSYVVAAEPLEQLGVRRRLVPLAVEQDADLGASTVDIQPV